MDKATDIAELTIDIDDEFRPHVASAIARFRYLHPELGVTTGDKVLISGVARMDAAAVGRDFKYALYREKIHAESADTRAALLGALLR
jgi:hypothetical protein